ncbi:sigma-70 family RNA polymerase sigma factor [Actinoplanes sp. LDG1-06]|uniref:Sigma-70 family RNA polymerase sigma factor n=1 Tax=Paractinoplanes ovalisporus TaxID=2810368 RepID=A0ABS2A9R0_9ACTN|nr:sigma-70 family RNA polymerase sigma factor [Actinoplanes ovalisporus]MBM2616572.1 sigma-70 family RNA polymerase sigma factor [Actinoplanes ovalisporus]
MASWTRRREGSADEVLIRQLYNEHGGALLAYATRLMGDRALGEDVVQETLIRAWRNPDALTNDKGSVRGYLFTITRNIAIDRHRARQARPAEVAETPSSTPVARDHADQVVDSMVVLGAMEKLSDEHQQVLRQIYFQGRTVEEAAETLGVPAGTVKSRSYYALRRLREAIAEQPAGPRIVAEGAA